jgi:Predicted integral membrane protein (DUF2269)
VTTGYVLIKFFHILIAILALGTSAGLGIVLEFYGSHPAHGLFLLRAIARIVALFVIPGYVLMLVTGLWMVNLSWPWTTHWILAALVLWSLGIALLSLSLSVLRKQVRLFQAEGLTSPAYVRASLLGRGLGAATGLVVVILLYLMVFKPGM